MVVFSAIYHFIGIWYALDADAKLVKEVALSNLFHNAQFSEKPRNMQNFLFFIYIYNLKGTSGSCLFRLIPHILSQL